MKKLLLYQDKFKVAKRFALLQDSKKVEEWREENKVILSYVKEGSIDLDMLMDKKFICDYCDEKDIEDNNQNDFAGCDGIMHNKKDGNYYLVLEHCRNEISSIEIKYCPQCGRKLFNE